MRLVVAATALGAAVLAGAAASAATPWRMLPNERMSAGSIAFATPSGDVSRLMVERLQDRRAHAILTIHHHGFAGLSWSPAAGRLAFAVGAKGLYVISRDGTGLRRITQGAARDVAWSPDGQWIAFVRSPSSASQQLLVGRPAGGPVRQIYAAPADGVVESPTWARRSDALAFTVSERDAPGCAHVVVATLGGSTNTIGNSGCSSDPSWSSDDRELAYVAATSSGRAIFIAQADGSQPRQLTPGPDDDSPIWSPSGRYVAFSRGSGSASDAGRSLAVANVNGTGVRALTRMGRVNVAVDWSPDSRLILFEQFDPVEDFGVGQLVTVAVQGGRKTVISREIDLNGGVSLSRR